MIQTKKVNSKPRLFILEDDETLAAHWRAQAEEIGWHVLVARSIEEGLEIVKKHSAGIKMALVDLMVPAYREDWESLQKLQRKREELRNPIIRSNKSTKPDPRLQSELHAELTAIDAAWRDLIVEDGGLLFLEEVALAKRLNDWKYAVLSATDQEKREPELETRHIQKYGHYIGWYAKPIEPKIVIHLLEKHLV